MTRAEANRKRAGVVSEARRGLMVLGVGINDADYVVAVKVDGVDVCCPFYSRWKELLKRCYGAKWDGERTVCQEWLTFTKFKAWTLSKDWEGKELDKDIKIKGNKHYSPETCLFVLPQANNLFKRKLAKHGEWPIGVVYRPAMGRDRFMAQHALPGRNQRSLGTFDTAMEAHHAWQVEKTKDLLSIANMHSDEEVKSAIHRRRLALIRDLNNGLETKEL